MSIPKLNIFSISPRLLVGACLVLSVVVIGKSTLVQSSVKSSVPKRIPVGVGVALAGAEFGVENPAFCNTAHGIVGRDYHYNSPASVQFFADHGFRFLRLPFRWERIQPQLGQPLDVEELAQLRHQVDAAARCHIPVILDLHNYGRYRLATPQGVAELVIDQRRADQAAVTRDHLADLWRQLARSFAGSPAVIAYGVMNEPHDMGASNWKQISQAVVTAIRTVDTETWVLVAGDQWSHANRFTEVNGPRAWIRDPSDRTIYEAHCYFDFDQSGKYQVSYDDELRRDPRLPVRGRERVQDFLDWCAANRVAGLIGEFGVPGNDPRWAALVEDFLQTTSAARIPSCAWAAGEWWGNYPLSLQPSARLTVVSPLFNRLVKFNRTP